MKRLASPNFDERRSEIAYIVLHYTGMPDAASALARLCDPSARVSAHYVIDEEGKVIQLVDDSHRAWHAGVSFWRGNRDLNSASIGIELVNPGHEFGYRPFPESQIEALKLLLLRLIERHGLSPKKCLLAHSDIAVMRKTDPGELFPWERLAKEGLGVWPLGAEAPKSLDRPSSTSYPQSQADTASLLARIGYDTSSLPAALRAFQRRFYPEKLSGEADSETIERLRALACALA
ncbi:MAG: N-acetylmuramoyl-L-alanine amidase [Alphaproteobacteria bacterium]|nr:N-acetylmuramoyl-L-alanine amidase [Alphaproteobacteria bacterium]